ncbi:outer membrane receptor for ferrienterochelin and colicins [Hymenobacter luteus]|uniref:Outer membrane receptor for ferrienterochelin and colicins n=2 Tax=Hymenobacter TaxID=89966 RepID=A0A7W9SXK9_9BACT|nr:MULTISPECIES: TonB-dependent receptor [Hymenobacter]MBB4599893.1 outer membrane receptor for ferrienterochelin and colicins [Hymenobacter latericoloratus]MBB6057797.1 outer membrane receptor for ferrienterochelin and colicins [Hymenobacter luteus]
MKHLFFCFALMMSCLAAAAQPTGTVRGVVRSEGKEVPFASIGLKGTTLGTTADEHGSYVVPNVPAGSYRLVGSAVGLLPTERSITVTAGQTTTLHLSLNPGPNALGDVVVSGTLNEVIRSESPVAVELYSPKLFRKNPAVCLFENLTMINGVRPQLNCNVCGTGDIHINGLEGPYTMVLIDGMPLVSSLSTVYGLSGIPSSLIERVEVVKGPASTLYGSEAVGGLINVITKNPAKAPRFSADVFATSHRDVNLDLGVARKIGAASTLLSTNLYHYNQRRDVNNDGFTDVPTQQRVSVFNKWTWARPEQQVASLAGRYYYEDRFGGQLNWSPEHRGQDSVYGESVYTSRYELLGQYQLPVRGQKILLSGTFNQHNQNSAYGTTLYKAVQRVGFGQLTWAKELSIRHNLLTGATYRLTWYDDNTPATASVGPNDTRRNAPDLVQLPGLFVQDEWRLTPDATLLLGLRYDYNSRHGSILSPRLNYKWGRPDGSQVWRVGLGNGYRVVNLFTEDHAALTGARQVVVPEALEPERSWNVNVNYNRFLQLPGGATLTLDGSVFYTYFTNKISPDYDTNPNQIIYRNLDGYAISRGLTLNTDLALSRPLKVMLGVTLLDVFRQEQPLEGGPRRRVAQFHSPPFSGTWAVSYTWEKLGLALDYTGQVSSPMALPVFPNDFRPGRSPWYALQNVQVTRKLREGLELYGGLKNLFNFLPRYALLRPFDPFDKNVGVDNPQGYTFDTSYNYAPIQGRRLFLGVRYAL